MKLPFLGSSMDKVLVFDVWGDFAHFRKYYTTTSPLSFSVPPRTALAGLISAIIGLDKDEYLKYFSKDQASIGLRIINPIKKVRMGENLINTKDLKLFRLVKKRGHEPRTQVRFEFIKDAKYRVYFYHKDDKVYQNLKEKLEQHKCVYVPCLGLSEHIANFKPVGEGEYGIKRKDGNGYIQIDSVVPKKHIVNSKVDFEDEREYFSVLLPAEMDADRTVTEYEEVLFERKGMSIKAQVDHYWKLDNDERILFL
jgi:CRISPR-associated protein Cas5h